MPNWKMTSALLGATALGFALAAPASAQTTEAEACDVLSQLVEEAGNNVSPDFADAAEVAEMSDSNACLLYIDRVESAGGITALAPAEGDTDAQTAGQAGAQADDQAVQTDQQGQDQQAGQDQPTGGSQQAGQDRPATQTV
jgi:hypothetical protein